jgi:pyruvate dehydrogenase E2 component (dihydrolipoamide acetyltransferase)
MADVSMPRLSDSMEEGTILKWLKSDGDAVTRGEELVEIETDKANMTYEADQDGTLAIVAQEGDTLPVGETIARIGEAAAAAPAAPAEPEGAAPAQAAPAAPPAESAAPEPAAPAQAEPAPAPEPAAPAQAERAPEPEPAAAAPEPAPTAAAEPAPEPAAAEGDPADNGHDGDRVRASPIARRMAREIGLELGDLEGTGPGGRIVRADVEAAAGDEPVAEAQPEAAPQEAVPAESERSSEPRAAEPEAAPPQEESAPAAEAEPEAAEPEPQAAEPEPQAAEPEPSAPAPVASRESVQSGRGEVETQELSRLQQTIARRMAESKATAPEFVLNLDVDMEEAIELRKQLKAAAGDGTVAPSFNDFVVKASALALRDVPRANGAYRDGRFELYGRVNVGVAVAARDALVVPTIFDADRKSLGQIARESRTLAERVREGAITPPELSSGTFSVSNLGMYGIASFVPVINPPQAAILGVGAMQPAPAVVDGELQVRTRMRLTLVCDHRILYGADAAEFLGAIRRRLEAPLSLAL